MVQSDLQGKGNQNYQSDGEEQRGYPGQSGLQFLRHPGHETAWPGQSGRSRYSTDMFQPAQYPTRQTGPLIAHNSSAQDHLTAASTYNNYPTKQQLVQIVVPNPHSTSLSGIRQHFPSIVLGLSEHDLTVVGAYCGQSLQLAPIQSIEPDPSVRLSSVAFQAPKIHVHNSWSSLSTPYNQSHSPLYLTPE